MQRRAQALGQPKKAIFIHQCNDCRELQYKRKDKNIVYQTDCGEICFLTIELCAECMNSNLALAENYETIMGMF
jgi:hypothetical protein